MPEFIKIGKTLGKEKVLTEEEKFTRWKVSLLLRSNAAINAELGKDSSAREVSYARSLMKENLDKIRTLDKQFYEDIEEV